MDKGKIPSRRGDLVDWYFHKLVPAIHKHKAAGKQIQLREAAYTLKAGLRLFSRRTSSASLQRDGRYREFIRHNETEGWNRGKLPDENRRVYAVATDEGVLFFSDSEKGMKARNSYLQHLADGFFNMTKGVETLKLYEMEIPSRQVAELADNCIDKLAKSDLRSADTQLRKSEFSFTSEKLAGKEMLEGAVCTDKYDLRPDYNNFDRLTKDFNLGISPRNYDVASLLYISENGYAGHVAADYFHPFSYEYEFRDLAGKLGDSIKARQSAPMSSHDFGYAALQMEARTMAKDILQSEFHIADGEFKLGGSISRVKKTEGIQTSSYLHSKEQQTGKSPDAEHLQDIPALRRNNSQRQVRHVASIAPDKKGKKQLNI
ncbi:hypothetical protein BUAKA3JSW_01288 [Bacteroides uniformis]|uniref:DUF6047 family protein n=1 Tax=Bacteroides uniformis TaxID=820 RepID=UPI000B04D30A|nr:DUF6047 family protein [Bacteroides uniformis]CAH2756399.1 hypothetical protein BUAKA3JSW_01288 [Bacteroides uniformis]